MAILTSILMIIGIVNNPTVNQSTTTSGSATTITQNSNGGGWDWTNHQVK
ncbi:MAG: hypothetical protein H7X71_04340 [Chitinophagales bacterium]|nr:hypothetical protein [Chitinophagales bacterium]